MNSYQVLALLLHEKESNRFFDEAIASIQQTGLLDDYTGWVYDIELLAEFISTLSVDAQVVIEKIFRRYEWFSDSLTATA